MNSKKNDNDLEGKVIVFVLVCSVIGLFISFLESNKNEPTSSSNSTAKCYVVPTPKPWNCTDDCSGHKAGYNWAKQKNITNPLDCTGNSNSFIEGCEYYVQEMQHETTQEACLDQYENSQYY